MTPATVSHVNELRPVERGVADGRVDPLWCGTRPGTRASVVVTSSR
jgi:hypothetical protein